MVPREYTFCYRIKNAYLSQKLSTGVQSPSQIHFSINMYKLIIFMFAINAVYVRRYFKIVRIDAVRIDTFLRIE